MNGKIEIYQSEDRGVELEVSFEQETVWLNRQQLAALFDRDVKTIGKHINNVFKEGELLAEATVAKFATVQIEGARQVERQVEHYNLDVIISVGYRVKSQRGTQFRIWATGKLKELLVQGYVVHEQRLAQKEQEIKLLRSGIQILGRAIEQKAQEVGYTWLETYAKGLELLDDYDHETLDKSGINKKGAEYPELTDYYALVDTMRAEFDSEVLDLFARSLKWLQAANFLLYYVKKPRRNFGYAYVFRLVQNKIYFAFAHSCPAEQVYLAKKRMRISGVRWRK